MRLGLAFLALLMAPGLAGAAEIEVPAEPGALVVALAAAQPGDVLRLSAIRYDGPVVIDRAVTIQGVAGSVIVGPGTGTVVRLIAPDVRLENVAVEGSGKQLDQLDAGIAIADTADRAQIIGNSLTGNLIGIDIQGGHDATVRGNRIVGREDLHRSERGPGLYVWNAPGLLAEDNEVSGGNDGIFITSSNKATYRNNHFHGVRFAIHSMYSNGLTVTGNRSAGNDMGYAFMYSHHLEVSDNLSENDRTHGFFLNFVNYAKLEHNEVRDGGEKCLFIYNSNSNQVTGNRLAGCGIGIHFTAGSEGNKVAGNAFIGNRTQVKYVGTRWLEWSSDEGGNHWSEQVSFDINGDGIADSPYRPNDMVDQITWSQPMAKLLMGSPAVQLIRWSQSRFPGLMPGGVIDSRPLMSADGSGLTTPDGQRDSHVR